MPTFFPCTVAPLARLTVPPMLFTEPEILAWSPNDMSLPTVETFDADGRVAVDAPCVECGYNVRTLAFAAACPECAHPVAHSVGRYFLPFAPAEWVRGLARGLLFILIAGGLAFVLALLLAVLAAFTAVTDASSGYPPGMAFGLEWALVQLVCGVLCLALAIYGLVALTRRDPALAGRPERFTARRLLRVCCYLLPLPTIFKLAFTLAMPSMLPVTGPAPFATPGVTAYLGTLMVLGAISSLLTWSIYLLVALALLRHLASLMRRVPRRGLVRFARIEFWGLLISVGLLVLGYGVFLIHMLPMMTAVMSAASGPGAAGTWPAAATQPYGATYTAYMTSTSPATSTTTSATTAPVTFAGPPFPRSPIGFMTGMVLGGVGVGLGFCGSAGFGIAAVILLIPACVALFKAAREAQENAGLIPAPPPAAGPPALAGPPTAGGPPAVSGPPGPASA